MNTHHAIIYYNHVAVQQTQKPIHHICLKFCTFDQKLHSLPPHPTLQCVGSLFFTSLSSVWLTSTFKWEHLLFFWLTSLSRNSLQIYPLCHKWQGSPVFKRQNNILLFYIAHSPVYFSTDTHLSCFHFLTIVRNAARR